MSTRFAILADVHLGLVGPQPDGKVYGDAAPILDRAVQHVMRIDPAHVVLLGDLVNRGYDDEYAQARTALRPVADRIVPVVGNHELQRASIADFERNMNISRFRIQTICGLPAVILSSGLENLPDTQWQGALDQPQLDFLDRELPQTAGALLVFVHHPIRGSTRHSEPPMHHLINSEQLQSRLDRVPGQVIVVSAHTHSASFVRRGRFSFLGAPALGFWPHAFLVVDVSHDRLTFQTMRLVANAAESPDASASDPSYRAAREGIAPEQSGSIPLVP
jgi:3',5'-cyclic AMP phosphodiesterase CpdA